MSSCVEFACEVGSGGDLIAPMTEHDLLEVVEIEEACALSVWGWEAYRAELMRPESIMLIARRAAIAPLSSPGFAAGGERTVCGFIAARIGDEMHVNNIGVLASYRRRGVGGALLAAALTAGQCRGARAAVLEVRAQNSAAQALYRRHGFTVVGRRRNYYQNPPEDALTMRAALAAQA